MTLKITPLFFFVDFNHSKTDLSHNYVGTGRYLLKTTVKHKKTQFIYLVIELCLLEPFKNPGKRSNKIIMKLTLVSKFLKLLMLCMKSTTKVGSWIYKGLFYYQKRIQSSENVTSAPNLFSCVLIKADRDGQSSRGY